MADIRRTRQFAAAGIGLLVGILLVMVLVLLVRTWSLADKIRQTQQSNTSVAHDTARTLAAVKSCTTPGQKCYERSKQQTAGVEADINKVTVYAAACADRANEQTVEQIQSCVIRRLGKDTPSR